MQTGGFGSPTNRLRASAAVVPDGIEVETIAFSELLHRAAQHTGHDAADLIKMDIEGAEHEIFSAEPADALRPAARLQIEYHPSGSATALFSRLASFGYRLLRDEPRGTDYGVAQFIGSKAAPASHE